MLILDCSYNSLACKVVYVLIVDSIKIGAAQGGMVRRLKVKSKIPQQRFLRVAGADDEELARLCEGFSPDSLMIIVKKKSSGCVCCVSLQSVKLCRQK